MVVPPALEDGERPAGRRGREAGRVGLKKGPAPGPLNDLNGPERLAGRPGGGQAF